LAEIEIEIIRALTVRLLPRSRRLTFSDPEESAIGPRERRADELGLEKLESMNTIICMPPRRKRFD